MNNIDKISTTCNMLLHLLRCVCFLDCRLLMINFLRGISEDLFYHSGNFSATKTAGQESPRRMSRFLSPCPVQVIEL